MSSLPQLIGGEKALKRRLFYPEKALQNKIEGRVTIQYMIDELGNTSDFKILEGIGYGCDEVVLNGLRDIKYNNKAEIRFMWQLSIDFKL